MGVNSRSKQGKTVSLGKNAKPPESFNFFQGCHSSAQPDWGAEISRFKFRRRRMPRPKA